MKRRERQRMHGALIAHLMVYERLVDTNEHKVAMVMWRQAQALMKRLEPRKIQKS